MMVQHHGLWDSGPLPPWLDFISFLNILCIHHYPKELY